MANRSFQIRKITPAIGAELSGVRLTESISESELDQIYAALIEHQVIFFHDQDINPAAHLKIACALGEPQPKHPVYPHLTGYENIVVLPCQKRKFW